MENIHLNSRLSYSVGEIAALRDLFAGLARGIKACRQYPPQHPIPMQFKRSFHEQLRACFEVMSYVAVRVEFDTLETADDIIYRGNAGNDSIAHMLHRDGIRFLEISSGVLEPEVDAFFDALVTCASAEIECNDIVNHFWQAGFTHIRYQVVDSFEPGDLAEISLDLEGTTESSASQEVTLPESAKSLNWPAPGSIAQQQAAETRRFMVETFGSIDEFSPHELNSLTAMIQEDRNKDLKSEVISLLLQLSAEPGNVQDLRLTTESLQVAFDRLIEEGKFGILISILRHVRKLIADGVWESPASKKRLVEFEQRCGDSVRIKLITSALNKNLEIDLAITEQYLDLLGWESLNSLLWMLGELAHFPARKMLCDLLTRKGAEKLDILGSAVFDSRWFVVRNVVWVLGEMKSERAVSYLLKAAKHAEERVRIEVVKAAAKLGGDNGARVLLQIIQDQSGRIRAMALEELGQTGSLVASAGLSQIVKSKEFAEFDSSEMQHLLNAFVATGSDESLAFCHEAIARTTLFNKAKLQRLQEAVAVALQFSNAPEAGTALEKLAGDSRPTIALIASKSLRQWRQRQRIPND